MARHIFNCVFIASAFVLFVMSSLSHASELSPGDQFAIAIERGDLDAVKTLIEGGAKADTPIDYGDYKTTPLMKACWQGEPDIVEYLLASGANVNAADTEGHTPLFNALLSEHPELVETLIKNGAKVNIKDSRQFTPLALAASAGDARTIEALAKAGADLSSETYGLTPLMFAVSSKKIEAVRLLVKLGAPVNYASKGGDPGSTALISAIYDGNADMVRALIDLNANVNVKTKSGNTPMKAARQGDQEDIIAILKEAGARK